ncbi:MAG TPA: methylmalonyl Co-A mutase-associated GTPase MeaB [Flavobacteriaceae bacterium]|nr:methylmalonyl Co-A mutase-associated GTPase MeaB [Flavobacteriaceae bacterium]
MKKKKVKSALQEKPGVSKPVSLNKKSAEVVIQKRKQLPAVEQICEQILQGNKTALSRAITMVESTAPKHQEAAQKIIEFCLPYSNNSVRIGITGVPGAGKSTFIESYGNYLIKQGKKVAVLAVDPSSSLSKGSILGDKTRMEELVKQDNAFIRPSAAGDSLGGVARKTRESIILCEAAGYDVIIIETVGVGQSETAVHSMTDFFLLLKIAGAGDELQGIKRGIMEMADAVVINKADGDNLKAAKNAKTEFSRALHLYPPKENGWVAKTAFCSALFHQGIDEINTLINQFVKQTKANHWFEKNRINQNKFWLLQTIDERLKSGFYNHAKIKKELPVQLDLIEQNKTTPFAAASYLLQIV